MYSGEDILWWWPVSVSTSAKGLQRYQSLEPIWYRFLGESVTGLAFLNFIHHQRLSLLHNYELFFFNGIYWKTCGVRYVVKSHF
jgi:hypothetical protein